MQKTHFPPLLFSHTVFHFFVSCANTSERKPHTRPLKHCFGIVLRKFTFDAHCAHKCMRQALHKVSICHTSRCLKAVGATLMLGCVSSALIFSISHEVYAFYSCNFLLYSFLLFVHLYWALWFLWDMTGLFLFPITVVSVLSFGFSALNVGIWYGLCLLVYIINVSIHSSSLHFAGCYMAFMLA